MVRLGPHGPAQPGPWCRSDREASIDASQPGAASIPSMHAKCHAPADLRRFEPGSRTTRPGSGITTPFPLSADLKIYHAHKIIIIFTPNECAS